MKIQFVVISLLSTIILSSCGRSECDALYEKLKTTSDEYVEVCKQLKATPTNTALQQKYYKLVLDVQELTKNETPCTNDNDFKSKIMVLMADIEKYDINPSELSSDIHTEEQKEAEAKLLQQAHSELEVLNKEVANLNVEGIHFSEQEMEALRGTFKGTFGTDEITIEIVQLDFNGQNVQGNNTLKGNNRPVEGTIKGYDGDGYYNFELSEPGTDKYDGIFTGKINREMSEMWGTWKPINGGAEKKFKASKI